MREIGMDNADLAQWLRNKYARHGELEDSMAADLIERLTRENEELRKDAERYRWIRTAGAWESEIGMDILSEDPIKFDRAVDDYLDAALAKQRAKDE